MVGDYLRRALTRERADAPPGHGMDEPPAQVTTFGGIANVRVPVGVFPQRPGDPIQQGVDTPARPARVQVAVLSGWNPQAVAEGRFIAAIVPPHPRASFPRTRMSADYPRSNIRVPPYVAYGSLFTSYGSQ